MGRSSGVVWFCVAFSVALLTARPSPAKKGPPVGPTPAPPPPASWHYVQRLKAPVARPNLKLNATGLALNTTNAAVGGLDPSNHGAVDLFVRSGKDWSWATRLAPQPQPQGSTTTTQFWGRAIAISSDTLVVGAPDNDVTDDGSGFVDVYTLVNQSWQWAQTLIPSASEPTKPKELRYSFGWSVSLSGSTLVVGANEFMSGAGRVFIFEKQSDGTFAQVQELSEGTDQMDEDFGEQVVVRGDTLVVTRPTAGTSPPPRAGRAYVYVRSGGAWTLQQVLKSPKADDMIHDSFGAHADLGDDRLAVTSNAAVYVFWRSAAKWNLTTTLDSPAKTTASSVAISPGATPAIFVGYQDATVSGKSNAGDVVVFRGAPPGNLLLRQKQPGKDHAFGAGLALLGDQLLVAAGTTSGPYYATLVFNYY